MSLERREERFIEIVRGELTSGIILKKGRSWDDDPGRRRTLARLERFRRLTQLISKKREALDRYLTAFEEGSMPKAHCSERVKEIGNEIEALEARKATLESEDEPPSFSRHVSERLKVQS